MRDVPQNKGKCPVLDLSPPLFVENSLAVEIYLEARKSAEFREVMAGSSATKTKVFVSAADVRALMDIYQVPKAEREITYRKVMLIQNIENDLSLVRSKK